MTRAPIALSCGEPSGIGPELAAKCWASLGSELPFFLIGDPRHVPNTCPVIEIERPDQTFAALPRGLPVLPMQFDGQLTMGQPNAAHAKNVVYAIEKAVELTNQGSASAVCTAPIHKQALQDGAGFGFPGHTEFLASLAGVDRVVMMLASDVLRVVPVTIHIALAEVKSTLTPQALEDTLRITEAGLRRDFAIAKPRLAVAGLNPHAGENGKMGREEIEIITPVLARLRDEGLQIRGPLSADTMFHASARAQYDAAICMYHDQALIPIKTLDFDRGVNVTLGLPFIRTSPDHGTALDIAGTGTANPTSMIEALKLAAKMADLRAGLA